MVSLFSSPLNTLALKTKYLTEISLTFFQCELSYYLIRQKCSSDSGLDKNNIPGFHLHVSMCAVWKRNITGIFLKLECESQAIVSPYLPSSVNDCASHLWNPLLSSLVWYLCYHEMCSSASSFSVTLPMYPPSPIWCFSSQPHCPSETDSAWYFCTGGL